MVPTATDRRLNLFCHAVGGIVIVLLLDVDSDGIEDNAGTSSLISVGLRLSSLPKLIPSRKSPRGGGVGQRSDLVLEYYTIMPYVVNQATKDDVVSWLSGHGQPS
jgi:hypothetical protein